MNDTVAALREMFAAAAHELTAAHAKDELLADLTERRHVLGLARPPIFVPRGRVWRLGVLLLGHGQTLYATGSVTRVTDTGRPNYQSPSVEKRREYRVTAVRSGLPMGETVNFNALPITLDVSALLESTGPLFLRDDHPFVRWSHSLGGDMTMSLDDYLRDRVNLLTDPPEGA